MGAIYDLRSPVDFGAGHRPGSINIPLGSPSTANWLAGVYRGENAITAIAPDSNSKQLVRELFSNIIKNAQITYQVWDESKEVSPLNKLPALKPQELDTSIANREQGMIVVDVRTMQEWYEGHLEGAMHIELFDLAERLNEVPCHAKVVTMCRSGMRSSIAGSIFLRNGFTNVFHLAGGINAWRGAGLHTVNRYN